MAVETNETRLATRYEAIRRREYELITSLLELLPKIDALGDDKVAQVRDALFHADHPFLMVFVGPFSSGKSSLINALLGEDLLAIGPVPTTDRISILRWGEEAQTMDSGGEVNTVFYPSELLKKVSFVDTPGLESIFQKHEETTSKFLHRSDVVILVMLATQAMSGRNLDYLRQLRGYGKKVIVVINQVDLLSDDEKETVRNYVLDQGRDVLGMKPEVWMISAKQGLQARRAKAAVSSGNGVVTSNGATVTDAQAPTEQTAQNEGEVAATDAAVTSADETSHTEAASAEAETTTSTPSEPVTNSGTIAAPPAPTSDELWRKSGLYLFEEYIDDQLDDVQRMRQKLQTPLQIIQNVHMVAMEAVRANQSVLDQYQGIADNVQQQLDSYKREQDKIVRELNEEITARFSESSERGNQAIQETFQLSQALKSVRRGIGELTGIARLFRRGGSQTYVRLAFERHKVYEPISQLPDISDKLGPRLEGKDVQDIDDLVKYAKKEVAALPPEIQSKVIGNIQSPSKYDRTILKDLRPKLEEIESQAREMETEKLDMNMRNALFVLAAWELILIVVIVLLLVGGGFNFSEPTAIIGIFLLIGLAMLGLLVLPLVGRVLQTGHTNRMLKHQTDYVDTLSKAADKQIEYGMRLRREVVAPLTRLVEAQTQIQTEQMNKLQIIDQEMVNIESELSKLGKKSMFGLRG